LYLFRRVLDMLTVYRQRYTLLCPTARIGDYLYYRPIVEDRIRLMTWPEIEDPAMSTLPAASASEDFATLEPRYENYLLWMRHIESLSVHFGVWQLDRLSKACRDGMTGLHHPQTLFFGYFPPLQRT